MGGILRPALALGFFASSLSLTAPAAADETISYSYDPRGRLDGVSRSGTVNDGISASYQYDKADNRTNVAVVASTVPTLSISSVSTVEGGVLAFKVTRSGPSNSAVSVTYATGGGTATAGSDYTAVGPTVLSFAAGDIEKPVNVTTIDDAVIEPSETVLVTLTSPTGGAVIATGGESATGTILDNDATGPCAGISYTVSDSTVTEGSPLQFVVTKSGTVSSSCAVSYATANGTAVAGTHYTAKSGTLTFTAAQTAQTVSVTSFDLSRLNATLNMYLNLSTPADGASLADPQGLGRLQASGGGGGGQMSSMSPEGGLDASVGEEPADGAIDASTGTSPEEPSGNTTEEVTETPPDEPAGEPEPSDPPADTPPGAL